MTTQVSITTSPEGSVLVAFARTSMQVVKPVVVSLSQGMLRVKQSGRTFVEAEFDDLETIFAFKRTDELLVAQVDDEGFEFFEKVVKEDN